MDHSDNESESSSSSGANLNSEEDETFMPENNIEEDKSKLVKQIEKLP